MIDNSNNNEIAAAAAAIKTTIDNETASNLNKLQINNEQNHHHHHHQDSNLVITTKHKEFQVVHVSDDSLLKEGVTPSAVVVKPSTDIVEEGEKEDEDKVDENETLDPLQLVEEGYATKKMDEYFRQTIDEIKKELSKRIEPYDEINEMSNNDDLNNLDLINTHQAIASTSITTPTTLIANNINNNNNNNNNNQSNVIIIPNSPINSKENENLNHNDAHHHHNFKSSPSNNCLECFINGHCILHNTSNHHQNHHHHTMTHSSPNNNHAVNIRFASVINWFLIVGSILNHSLIDGFCFNYSNLFLYVQNAYATGDEHNYDGMSLIGDDDVNNSSLRGGNNHRIKYLKLLFTLPGSLLIAIYLLFIPISLYVGKRFGIRLVALVGSLISTLSILATSFLKMNFGLFILFYSLLNGMYCLFSPLFVCARVFV